MATHIPIGEGKRFQMGKGDSRHLVSPEIGAQQLTLNYSVFQPGQEFPQHVHDRSADIFIVLDGGVSVRQGDSHVPINAGEFAYIPPGEVHGTVNQTDARAILISFQSPPDPSLYRGERDPAVTGTVPRPPENHVTTVQIRQLKSGETQPFSAGHRWTPASPTTGTKEMILWYVELESRAQLSVETAMHGETIWFIWEGQADVMAGDTNFTVQTSGAVFVQPGEAQTVTNRGTTPLRLIRCQAISNET